MAVEIERKFLVLPGNESLWQKDGTPFRQGYLNQDKERTVRVRTQDKAGYLTIKGISQGARRSEFEYPVPLSDAQELLENLCIKPLVEKTRYRVDVGGQVWEIDVFHGANQGLVVAELELSHEDQAFERPPWLGREVTGEERYFNSRLGVYPYTQWTAAERGG